MILGGHIDSINGGAAGRAPGADDDASGSVGVLETFHILMANGFRPSRTVEFHAYAAEEVGLRGSQAIAEAYAAEGRNVASMMQLDMTGYVGKEPEIGIVTDYTSDALNVFVRTLVNTYCAIKYVDTKCGYGCSDHASWTKEGWDRFVLRAIACPRAGSRDPARFPLRRPSQHAIPTSTPRETHWRSSRWTTWPSLSSSRLATSLRWRAPRHPRVARR